jgi:predicted amidohydrolase
MRVALLQVASPLDESPADRIARIGGMVRALDDVDLVVLPELWAPGYFAFEEYDERAETMDGPFVAECARWARRLEAHLHVGSFIERDADGRLHNTALLLGPDGDVLLSYRKVHVFGYRSLESRLLSAGERVDAVATGLGTVGTTTCYDLRFPELYRMLVDLGVEVLVVPAAWPLARLEHWRLLTRTRAVENQMVVLACNAAGRQGDVSLAGHSVVVDPWGRVLAEAAGTEEEILYVDVDLSSVGEVRAEFPVLRDRRSGIQAGTVTGNLTG